MRTTQKLSNAFVDENVIARWFAIICKWHSLKDKSSREPNFIRLIPIVAYLTNFLPLIFPGLTVEEIDKVIVWLINNPKDFECNNHKVYSTCEKHIGKIKKYLGLINRIELKNSANTTVECITDKKQIDSIANTMIKMYKSSDSTKPKSPSKSQTKHFIKEEDFEVVPAFTQSAIEGMKTYFFDDDGSVTVYNDFVKSKNNHYEIDNMSNVAKRLNAYVPNKYSFIKDKTLAQIISFINTDGYYVRQTANDPVYSNARKFLATHRVQFAVVRKNKIEYLIEVENKSCPSVTKVKLPEWYVNALNRNEYTLVDSNWNLYDYSDGLIAAINIYVNRGRSEQNQYCYRMDNHHFDMKKERSGINKCLNRRQLPTLLLPEYYSSGCRFCYDSHNLRDCSYCMCCIISTGLISCRYTSYSDRIYGGYMVSNCKDCKFVYYLANSSCCFNCAYSYRLVQCMCCINCIGLAKGGQINKSGWMVNDVIKKFTLNGYMTKKVINNHEYSIPTFDFIKLTKFDSKNKKKISKKYKYTWNTNGIYVDHDTKEKIFYIGYDAIKSFDIIESIGSNVMKEIKEYRCGKAFKTSVVDEREKLRLNINGKHEEEDGYHIVETSLMYPNIPCYLIHLEALRGYDDDWDILDEESEESNESEESEENIVDDY